MIRVLAVAVGGALGALLRYAVVVVFGRLDAGFPYATLAVNVVGCAAIGIALFLIDGRAYLNPQWRAFIVTGLLGSLTTFSTFGFETYALWMEGERALAVSSVAANVVLGLAAVVGGWRLAAGLF